MVETLETIRREIPKGTNLMLHSCCGPCSLGVIEQLGDHFALFVYFYNPNILPQEEYQKRLEAQKTVLEQVNVAYPIRFLEGAYEPAFFLEKTKDFTKQAEGGKRCDICFALRFRETAKLAKRENISHFTSTLSIGPRKNAVTLGEIGKEIAQEQNLRFLSVDFKKNAGFQRSVALSKELGIYRQQYCGCALGNK